MSSDELWPLIEGLTPSGPLGHECRRSRHRRPIARLTVLWEVLRSSAAVGMSSARVTALIAASAGRLEPTVDVSHGQSNGIADNVGDRHVVIRAGSVDDIVGVPHRVLWRRRGDHDLIRPERGGRLGERLKRALVTQSPFDADVLGSQCLQYQGQSFFGDCLGGLPDVQRTHAGSHPGLHGTDRDDYLEHGIAIGVDLPTFRTRGPDFRDITS